LRLIATQVFDDKSMKGFGGQAHGVLSEMQMPNQNAKFVSAVFAGVLAGANFTPALSNSAHAEDSCLAAPNGQTPQGSHWYYRLEHGTKRHCWYLREGSDTHEQSAAVTSSPAPAPAKPAPAKPAPAKAEAPVQGSVANARAELPWPQQRTTPDTSAPAVQASAAPAADMPSSDSGQPATSTMPTAAAGNTDVSQTALSSRWPNQLSANASDDSAPAADNSDASAQQPDTAAMAPPPATAAAVPLAAADAPPSNSSSNNKQPGSMSTLLTIMISALALAGLVGGAILRFGGRNRRKEEEIDIDRRPAWDVEHNEHPLPYPAAPVPAAARQPNMPRPNMQRPNTQRPNIGRPRELRTVEPDDSIKEMLARLARSAQT
jgi:hypothetical protein